MNNAKLEKEVDVFAIGENVKASNGSEERRRFAISLSTLLASKGIGQKQLAEQVGMTEASISEYCTGKKDPKLTTIVRMAAALGVDCNRLLTGVDAEYKEISETTGLSQKAIDNLRRCSHNPCFLRFSMIEVFNHIIEANNFTDILFQIAVALDCCYAGTAWNNHARGNGIELDDLPRILLDYGYGSIAPIAIPMSEYGEYALSNAMQSFSELLKTLYKNELIKSPYFEVETIKDEDIPTVEELKQVAEKLEDLYRKGKEKGNG